MARIKATTLLKLEELPEQFRTWLARIIGPINDYINQSIAIINGGVTFGDQMLGVDHLFQFTYTSDSVNFPLGFQWTLKLLPQAMTVVSALENNNAVMLVVSWQYTQSGQVQIVNVVKISAPPAPALSTLTVGAVYKIRARITP